MIVKPTVLIVEDEPLLRMVAADYLDFAGYETIEACNADEAIQILETGADISVMYTDVDMPGRMDGIALAVAVRDRWPPIDIIVTSGQRVVGLKHLPERSMFFQKPHDWPQLVTAIKRFSH